MKLSVSNIAWTDSHDRDMYRYLSHNGFKGLEIAPTRIFPEKPYDKLGDAVRFKEEMKETYNLEISSMQSILFQREEKLFGTNEERQILKDYTKKSIDFANALGCRNLVFGSPKNRIIESDDQYCLAVDFFRELGQYAVKKDTVLAIEANPALYGTNFINTTRQAFGLVKDVNIKGFRVNIDCGTMIHNNEGTEVLSDNMELINHIHISEPYLIPVKNRQIHRELSDLLKRKSYDKYVSLEMKNIDDIENLKLCIKYIKEVFNAD